MMTPKKLNYILLLLITLLMVFGLYGLHLSQSPTREDSNPIALQLPAQEEKIQPTTKDLAASSVLTVKVMVNIDNIYHPSLKEKTYFAGGSFWLEWPQAVQDLIEQGKVERLTLVKFANQIEPWNSSLELSTPNVEVLGNQSYRQKYRFAGQFYVNEIDFHHSPFNQLVLPFVLAESSALQSLVNNNVILVPFENQSNLLGENASINGYHLLGANIQAVISRTQSQFIQEKFNERSQVVVRVFYQTNAIASFVKWIVPIIIVMMIVLIAPNLDVGLGDARLAIPPTALLTLIFMQQSYRDSLPTTSYLTFLDELYTHSYFVAMIVFFFFVWGVNTLETETEIRRIQTVNRIVLGGKLLQILSLLGYLFIVLRFVIF